ncbi:uncharacterized protein LOC135844318 [Planococcus citri]|uniref:uncharacterized protein LOC135844318 n=1 Tax=Planococcus citri TaxID=170843 RepID=UPI0031F77F9E
MSPALTKIGFYEMKIALLFGLCFIKLDKSNARESYSNNVTLSSDIVEIINTIRDSAARDELHKKLLTYEYIMYAMKKKNDELRRKQTHHGFICALRKIKGYIDICYDQFKQHYLPPAAIPWPENFIEKIINISDVVTFEVKTGKRIGKKKRNYYAYDVVFNRTGDDDVKIENFTYNFDRKMNELYYMWNYIVASGDEWRPLKIQFAIELKKQLDEYYENHRAENDENPYYANKAEFYKYFAALVTRAYKLGCLYFDDLCYLFELRGSWFYDYPDEEIPFRQVLLEHMPNWFFTIEHLELINLIWRAGGARDEKLFLKVKVEMKNKKGQDVIIPYSEECLID